MREENFFLREANAGDRIEFADINGSFDLGDYEDGATFLLIFANEDGTNIQSPVTSSRHVAHSPTHQQATSSTPRTLKVLFKVSLSWLKNVKHSILV